MQGLTKVTKLVVPAGVLQGVDMYLKGQTNAISVAKSSLRSLRAIRDGLYEYSETETGFGRFQELTAEQIQDWIDQIREKSGIPSLSNSDAMQDMMPQSE